MPITEDKLIDHFGEKYLKIKRPQIGSFEVVLFLNLSNI